MTARSFRMAFLWLGILIFAGLLYKIGLTEILSEISLLSWMTIPVLLVGLVWNILYTLAWKICLNDHATSLSLWALFKIKLAGEAVNTVTPINFVGGDPLRIYLLRRHMPSTNGAASVVIDRTLQMMATIITLLLGVAVTLPRLHFLPMNVKYGLPLALAVATAFVAFIFAHQHKGLFGFLMNLLKRLRLKKNFSAQTISKFEDLDAHIGRFYTQNRRGFWVALSYHIAGRVLGILEIYLIGMALTPTFDLTLAIVLGTVAPLINFIFTFVPGAIGIMEGAYGIVILYFGLPATMGVAIQVIKRLRSAIWIGLGFISMSGRERHKVFDADIAAQV